MQNPRDTAAANDKVDSEKADNSESAKAKLDDKIGVDDKPEDKRTSARQTTAPGKGRSR